MNRFARGVQVGKLDRRRSRWDAGLIRDQDVRLVPSGIEVLGLPQVFS